MLAILGMNSNRKHRSLTFVDNALHVLYTRVFIRKFPSIFEKSQNYVRPSAMHISNLVLIKLMKVLKNNLAENDILFVFVISGYGPFIFIRPSKYYSIPLFVRPSTPRTITISHLFPLLLIGHVVTYMQCIDKRGSK